MNTDLFGLSWRPSDHLLDQPSSEMDYSGKSPDEILTTSIIERNLSGVQHAIALGANTKMLVGKEKLSVFCMRHFNKDIVELLDKNGVSFKDINNISFGIAAVDDVDALEWFFASPRMQKVLNDKDDGSRFAIFAHLAEHGAVDCLMWCKDKHPALVSQVFKSLFHRHGSTFMFSALKKSNMDAFEFAVNFEAHAPSETVLSNFLHAHAHEFNLADCHFLEASLTQKPIVADVWRKMWDKQSVPSRKSLIHSDYVNAGKVSSYKISTKCFSSDKPTHHYHTYSYAPRNFMELLVIQGNELICSLNGESQEKMSSLLFNSPQSSQLLFGMLGRASRGMIKNFFDHYPQAHLWRDETGSNLFHYLLVRSSDISPTAPKVLYEAMFAISPDLCLETNQGGIHAFAHIQPDLQASLQSKMMKKELKKAQLHKGHAEANTARKRKM